MERTQQIGAQNASVAVLGANAKQVFGNQNASAAVFEANTANVRLRMRAWWLAFTANTAAAGVSKWGHGGVRDVHNRCSELRMRPGTRNWTWNLFGISGASEARRTKNTLNKQRIQFSHKFTILTKRHPDNKTRL